MLKNVNKNQNCDRLNFTFVQISLENQCILHLTLYKDVYQLVVKLTLIVSSETKASLTIIALNDGKCQYFY